ncbi:MAG: hypothetical protein IPL72_15260 [Sulfuritalea sp.]|nr:hypothetical protein [Sulfuritalea sp.]
MAVPQYINAAMAGLVGAYMVGLLTGYGKESMALHSLTMTGDRCIHVSSHYLASMPTNLEANGLDCTGDAQHPAGAGAATVARPSLNTGDQGQALDAAPLPVPLLVW